MPAGRVLPAAGGGCGRGDGSLVVRWVRAIGDHDYPCAIFPDSLWLKRSLAHAPGAEWSTAQLATVCRRNYAGAGSGMSDTPTARHDREPLRTLEVLLLGSRVMHD
jgi:hypothetical protein